VRYESKPVDQAPISGGKDQVFQSLAQKFSAFTNEKENELDREVMKKGQEQGLIDAQGKTAITLRDGNTIADEAWNKGAIASHMSSIKLDLTENLDRIATENPDPEAYSEISKKYTSGLLEGIDDSLKPLVQDEASSLILKGRMKSERALRSSQLDERRIIFGDALDVTASQALDAADSMNLEESDKYQQQHSVFIDAAIADTTITPAEGAKFKSELKENLDDGIVIGQFKSALDAGKDEEFLKKFSSKKLGNFFSPDKREKLLSEMLTLRNHRKSIDAIKKTEGLKEINLYTKALADGFVPSKEDTTHINSLAADAGLSEELDKKVDDIQKVAYYGKAPAADRRAKIEELGKGGELEDYNKWKALKEADARITKMAQDDGYTLAIQQKIIEPTPIDYKQPASFASRNDQAKFLSKHYGVEVSPFTDAETKQLVDATAEMTPAEMTDLAMSIGAMGNTKILKEITKKQAPVFAMMAAIGVPQVSETVFLGQRELKLGNIELPKGDDKISMQGEMSDYLSNVYTGEDLAATIQSIQAHYAAMNGNNNYNKDVLMESMKAVTGGIAKINGYAIELPRGIEEDEMEDFIDDFSNNDVVSIGGVDNRTPDDAAKMIRDGIWRSRPGGVYAVITPFGELMQNGKPLRIKYDPSLSKRTPLSFEEFQEKRQAPSGDMMRQDGTEKQSGFFGELERPDGRVSTEISIGMNIDGKEVELPTLVPTLTKKERDWLINEWEGGSDIPKAIKDKAVKHAIKRMKEGKSPFWTPGEKVYK